jgi:hypothetical protein
MAAEHISNPERVESRLRFKANDATLSGLGVLDGVSTQGGATLALGYDI